MKEIKCEWTVEMTDDLKCYGIDAEAELIRILNGEINKPIIKDNRVKKIKNIFPDLKP